MDYYLSGVKIDPKHFGCVYNVACSYYFEEKYINSLKWFELAMKIDPKSQDCYFGKTACCLKLGKFEQALNAIDELDNQVLWTSEIYKKEQCTFLHAVCSRIMNNLSKSNLLYSKLSEGIRKQQQKNLVNITGSVMLLPLHNSRRHIESLITDFVE